MPNYLDFEQPIVDLEERIATLEVTAAQRGIDVGEEVKQLRAKADRLSREIFGNLQPWQRVQLARHVKRPTTLDYVQHVFGGFLELHGDRLYRDDEAIVGGLAFLGAAPVMVIGHQKGRDTKSNIRRNFGMAHPEGYRKALRLMQMAERFGRPVITFIDTPGAFPGVGAEERGQGEAIARNLREMAMLRVPVVCVVTGEGGSGGALALGVGDRLYMQENAVYSVISPEGCAAILWRDGGKAAEAARAMRLTAQDARQLGVIDGVIREPIGGAHRDPEGAAREVLGTLRASLHELQSVPVAELREKRLRKYLAMGVYAERG